MSFTEDEVAEMAAHDDEINRQFAELEKKLAAERAKTREARKELKTVRRGLTEMTADRDRLVEAATRRLRQCDRYRLAWESASRGRREARITAEGIARATAILGDALGFVVMAVDAWQNGAAPHDVLVLIRDEFAGGTPGEPPADRVPVVEQIADAVIAHRFPPHEWPDGPPGDGEDGDALALAAEIVATITGL